MISEKDDKLTCNCCESDEICGNLEVEDYGDDPMPFDSTKIDIDIKQPTISNIIARLEDEEIDLDPEFQREQNLWSIKKQSQLIESIILKIPLPAFYFDEERKQNQDGTISTVWHVVDGLQRICALRNFILGSNGGVHTKLKGLEFLQNCENMTYEQLPRPYKRIINETQLTAYLMKPSTPIEVKYNVFKRVNTGGVPLNQQEIRHALNQGRATRFLLELAKSSEFVSVIGNKLNTRRMQDRELVNRFLAFYLQNLDDYRNMDGYLDSVLKRINEDKMSDSLEIIAEKFRNALSIIEQVLGDIAFRREPGGRINKALFEVFTVLVSRLDDFSADILKASKDARQKYERLVSEDGDFKLAVTTSTGNIARIRMRYELVQSYLDDLIYG